MFFLYSIPEKAYALRHVDGKTRPCLVMSPYLIKAMRKFYVFNNIIHQKYEPTQRSIYSYVCYQFAIYFMWVQLVKNQLKIWREKKLWPLTIDHSGDNEDSISFFIFSYLQWNMITTKFTSMQRHLAAISGGGRRHPRPVDWAGERVSFSLFREGLDIIL
jgi:hypothetical protein